MKVRGGRREQWRKFELARDIPQELHQWVNDFAQVAECHPKIGHDFTAAIKAALEVVDAKAIKKANLYATAWGVLVDIWEYGPELRKWLNAQAHEALDKAEVPPPDSLRPKRFW